MPLIRVTDGESSQLKASVGMRWRVKAGRESELCKPRSQVEVLESDEVNAKPKAIIVLHIRKLFIYYRSQYYCINYKHI